MVFGSHGLQEGDSSFKLGEKAGTERGDREEGERKGLEKMSREQTCFGESWRLDLVVF